MTDLDADNKAFRRLCYRRVRPGDFDPGGHPMTLRFFVPGHPAPQGSKRHIGRGIMVESSRRVKPWRESVGYHAHEAMAGRPLFAGALAVDVTFVMPRPKSTPKRSTPPAVKRPDLDKLLRAVFDALHHVVYPEDAQIVQTTAHKRLAEIGEVPGAQITVTDCGAA